MNDEDKQDFDDKMNKLIAWLETVDRTEAKQHVGATIRGIQFFLVCTTICSTFMW